MSELRLIEIDGIDRISTDTNLSCREHPSIEHPKKYVSSLTGIKIPAYEALRAERPADADTIALNAPYSTNTNLL